MDDTQHVPARDVWPIYDLERHKANLMKPGSRTGVLVGVRGAGKSTLLRELCRDEFDRLCSVPRTRGSDEEFERFLARSIIRGRNPKQALVELESLLAEAEVSSVHPGDDAHPGDTTPVETIFIDDFDYMLERCPPEGDLFKRLDAAAYRTLIDLPSTGRRVVLSWSRQSLKALTVVSTSSLIAQAADREHLPKPWKHDWRRKVREIASTFSGGQALCLSFAGVVVAFDDELVALWTEVMLELSGGHPTIVAAALDSLEERAEAASESAIPTWGIDRQTVVRAAIASVLQVHLARTVQDALQVRVAFLGDSRDGTDQQAFDTLIALARADNGRLPVRVPTDVLLRVEQEGLAYWDEGSGDCRLLGVMIRDVIRDVATRRPGLAVFSVVADVASHRGTRRHADRGRLVMRSGGREHSVAVSGSAWTVLQALSEHPGVHVPATELAQRLGSTDEGPVRAAIQRLKATLKPHGAADALGRKRGEGYCFNPIAHGGRGPSGVMMSTPYAR